MLIKKVIVKNWKFCSGKKSEILKCFDELKTENPELSDAMNITEL